MLQKSVAIPHSVIYSKVRI